jgi:hypothetical protein
MAYIGPEEQGLRTGSQSEGGNMMIIALMMEAVRTSETLVHSNETTGRYIPKDSKFQLFIFLVLSWALASCGK